MQAPRGHGRPGTVGWEAGDKAREERTSLSHEAGEDCEMREWAGAGITAKSPAVPWEPAAFNS